MLRESVPGGIPIIIGILGNGASTSMVVTLTAVVGKDRWGQLLVYA